MSDRISLAVEQAAWFIAGLFKRAGLSPAAAAEMGRALVDADVAGLPSHGLSQAGMYERSWVIRQAAGGQIEVPAALVAALQRLANEVGLSDRVLC